MDRDDADKHVEKLKKLGHLDVGAYKHIAKVFEFILYELDGIKDREAELPSVYGSWAGEPLYKDYEEDDEREIELPEMVDLQPVEKIDDDALDDRNVPMVLAYDASLTPFPVAEATDVKEEAVEAVEDKKDTELAEETPRDDIDDKAGVSSVKLDDVKPKRLKVVGEEEKKSLHTSSLKRVKESLRTIRKKKDNVEVEIKKA